MKEVKLTLYKFEELPREIIDNIVNKKRWEVMRDVMESYGWDYNASLEAFEKLTDSKAVHWDVYYCTYYFRTNVRSLILDEDDYPDADYLEELTGEHLYRYVMKNIYPYLLDKSKQLKECPLTDMCYDNYLLDPLLKYIEKWETYNDSFTYADLMEQCYDSFFSEWHKEYKYWADTDSAIKVELENWYRDTWFDENGNKCNIKYEEIA